VNLPVLDNVPLPNPIPSRSSRRRRRSMTPRRPQRRRQRQVNLKSGTAHYHGDAYEFFRNNVLNANDFFFNAATPQVPRRFFARISTAARSADLFQNQGLLFLCELSRNARGVRYFRWNSAELADPVLPTSRDAATLAAAFLPAGFQPRRLTPWPWPTLTCQPRSACVHDGKFCIPSVAGTPGFSGQSVNLGTVNGDECRSISG